MKSIFVLGECNQFRCLILEMNQRKYTTHMYDIDILIDKSSKLHSNETTRYKFKNITVYSK